MLSADRAAAHDHDTRRRGPNLEHTLTRDDVRRLGLQSGARWVVTGGIVRGDGRYVLDVTMEKTAGDVEPRPFTVTSSSLIALADQVATRLAGLATTGGAREEQFVS